MLYDIGIFFQPKKMSLIHPRFHGSSLLERKDYKLSKAVNFIWALPIKLCCECENTDSKILNVGEIVLSCVLILLDERIEPL